MQHSQLDNDFVCQNPIFGIEILIISPAKVKITSDDKSLNTKISPICQSSPYCIM